MNTILICLTILGSTSVLNKTIETCSSRILVMLTEIKNKDGDS
jgi:hypothetical protein